jgi:hypothetical protein
MRIYINPPSYDVCDKGKLETSGRTPFITDTTKAFHYLIQVKIMKEIILIFPFTEKMSYTDMYFYNYMNAELGEFDMIAALNCTIFNVNYSPVFENEFKCIK